jgi:hypothetical protein
MKQDIVHAKTDSPQLASLLSTRTGLSSLGPGMPMQSCRRQLEHMNLSQIFGRPIVDVMAAEACRAGLWLYFDFLTESHQISQSLATAEGSFWHAIMHRREPDPENSKYWWRRVGSHPVIHQLVQSATSVGYDYHNPFQFVDDCERIRDSGQPEEWIAQQVQRLEWELLFDYCYRKAVGLLS